MLKTKEGDQGDLWGGGGGGINFQNKKKEGGRDPFITDKN